MWRYLSATFLLISLLSFSPAQQTCNPDNLKKIPLQLGKLAKRRSIDTCACTGAPKGDAGSPIRIANDLQNSIKNNFFAKAGHPKQITVSDMIELQKRVDSFTMDQFTRGDRFHLPSPSQRTLLKNMNIGSKIFSEGDVVTLIGFVLSAQHSNVTSGESVNCNLLGCSNNDIHIEVTVHPDDPNKTRGQQMNEEGVVAEISPRHRPDEWDTFDSPDYTEFFKAHPVMFTGQLFFDGSHSAGGSPDRVSVWEVHPVYAIWICLNNTIEACLASKKNNKKVWLPFDELKNHLGLTSVHSTKLCQDHP